MFRDPIVEEVRKHREENARRFGYDVRAIAEDARKREGRRGHKLTSFVKRAKRKTTYGRGK